MGRSTIKAKANELLIGYNLPTADHYIIQPHLSPFLVMVRRATQLDNVVNVYDWKANVK